nr:putative ribonuclease H-like domain-containing protein [Tanacetum cinerariifolium]
MALEEMKEKFDPVWKLFEDFIPIGSKEEAERFKIKGLRLEQDSAKKVKTSEEVSKEDLKDMMQLVPVKEVYVEALQHFDREDLNQLWALVKETLNIRQAANDKENELWVDLKRNKARLVAQGHTQEEGIDYEEVFALVERVKAIRLFLAYASFMGFTIYQMDVKSAFLYGTINEEVYAMQPLRFQDQEFPDRVYKVEKAMYGLHQAPRAWYGTLSKYLLDNGFQRGTIDQILFIRKHKGEFLLVQVYVDDIIFG